MLPDWIPQEAWNEFVAMRKKKKKPLTEYATKLAIKKLEGFRSQGQNVEDILNNSIFHEWEGLFAVAPPRSSHSKPEKFDPTAYVNRNRSQSNERTIIIDEHGEPV
jgi:hypothetical protein